MKGVDTDWSVFASAATAGEGSWVDASVVAVVVISVCSSDEDLTDALV